MHAFAGASAAGRQPQDRRAGRQLFQLDQRQVLSLEDADNFAANEFLILELPQVLIGTDNQFAALVDGKTHPYFTLLADDVIVGQDQFVFPVNERAGAAPHPSLGLA